MRKFRFLTKTMLASFVFMLWTGVGWSQTTVTSAAEYLAALNNDAVSEITLTGDAADDYYRLYNLSEDAAFSRTTPVTVSAEADAALRILYADGQDFTNVAFDVTYDEALARGAVLRAERSQVVFDDNLGTDAGLANLTWDDLITAMYFYKEQAIPKVNALGAGTVKTNLESRIAVLTTYYEGVTALDMTDKDQSVYTISTGVLETFTGLETLSLSGTGIDEIGGLVGLTNMTDLDISNNAVTSLAALGDMASLTSLDASNNLLIDINAIVLDVAGASSPKLSLTTLDLSYNELTGIVPLVQLAEDASFSADGAYWNIGANPLPDDTETNDHIARIQTVFDAATDATFITEMPSTYGFSYAEPSAIEVYADELVDVTFATETLGDVGYDNVRFSFSASGPGDVTFKATDTDGTEHTFTNSGYWGPSTGFNIPADYLAIETWTLNFSEVGDYTITFNLIEAPEGPVIDNITDQVTVSVDPVPLTISGITIDNKVYDGTTDATIGGTASLDGVVTGDDVTLDETGATAAFVDADVADAKAVTVSGYALGGADAANYALTQPSGLTADIIKATPVLSVTNSPVTYDGTPKTATVEATGVDGNSLAGSVTNVLMDGVTTQTDVGTYAVTANFVPEDDVNYETLTDASAGVFEISNVTYDVTFTEANSLETVDLKVYTNAAMDAGEQVVAHDASGVYGINLEAGDYWVQGVLTGYDNYESSFTVVDATDPGNIDFEMTETTYSVTFTVTDGTDPIEDAEVLIDGFSSLTTNASGQAFIQLPNDAYMYDVTALGFNSIEAEEFTVNGSDLSLSVEMTEMTYTVTFTVTDGTDPIEGAEILIDGSSLTTDASGEALIELSNGIYTYDVTAAGYDALEAEELTVSDANLSVDIVLSETVSVDDLGSTITVYPNPSAGLFNITTTENVRLQVFDVSGKILISKQVNGNAQVTLKTAGMYFFRLSNENGSVVKQVIVK